MFDVSVLKSMLPFIGLAALCSVATANSPVGLIRKHPHEHFSITDRGDVQKSWESHRRAPTGHKYEHLHGFQAAFEEMKAIQTKAFTTGKERWDAIKQHLEEECSAAGELCKKSIDAVKGDLPMEKEEKLEYLCTSQALSCLSSNLDSCQSVHEEIKEMQKEWQCEAIRCSNAGPNCSTAVMFLEMDDSKLSDETRQKKTRFLCSPDAKQCLTDHKDLCKTAFDIVATANEMGHCDKIRCSDAGDDCRMAVSFLTQDNVSNATVKESKEKWSYLCGDAPFQCLETNLDQCTTYYNSLKLAFAEGHCNSARCASAGPACAQAVSYLSHPDKFYYGEELRNKTKFLCSDKAIECIMEHTTCLEFQEAAKTEYQKSACGRSGSSQSGQPQVDVPEVLPIGDEVDARTDAARAYARKKAKEREEKDKKMLVKSKAVQSSGTDNDEKSEKDEKGENGENGGSHGENSKSNPVEDMKEKVEKMTTEEKEKAGKKIFGAMVLGIIAIVGFVVWRRKKSETPPESPGSPTSPTSPAPDRKPPKPKLLQRIKQPLTEAASALGEVSKSGSAFAARLRAMAGFGVFKKDEPTSEEGKASEPPVEPTDAAGSDVKEPPKATAEPKAAAAPASEAPPPGPEEPREY